MMEKTDGAKNKKTVNHHIKGDIHRGQFMRDKTRRRLLIQQAQGLPNWCKCVATRVWNGREERLHPTKGWKRV